MTGHRLKYRRLSVPESSNRNLNSLKAIAGGIRIGIYTDNPVGTDQDMLEWCDKYFAVNLTHDDLYTSNKITPLGPLFGIKSWGMMSSLIRAVHATLAGLHWRSALAQSRFQRLARLPLDAYTPAGPSAGDYVFSAARRWAPRHPKADVPREKFFRALGRSNVEFEGGFLHDRLSLTEYICRIRRSSLTFNCPAVHGCLGWKLGEFLALGKAIISTPISRVLPARLVHGRHVHFVPDDENAMFEAIEQILEDHRYRRRLEQGAREWYLEHISPPALTRRLVCDGGESEDR